MNQHKPGIVNLNTPLQIIKSVIPCSTKTISNTVVQRKISEFQNDFDSQLQARLKDDPQKQQKGVSASYQVNKMPISARLDVTTQQRASSKQQSAKTGKKQQA